MTQQTTPRQRRSRGKAWHWKQTDCWYYTPPGTKKRVRLLDERRRPIRGQGRRSDAELALARIKAAGEWRPASTTADREQHSVVSVCSEFVTHCQQRAAKGAIGAEYRDEVSRYLNDFCGYCGALDVSELKKGHVLHWLEGHETWRSSATRRFAITCVQSAFNHAVENHGIDNPLVGLDKPPQKPRLHSITPEDEELIYASTDEPFGSFLFAAIHTGLRPFCELARLTTKNVLETHHGMMWRVYSSKTDKTRTIPVRSEVAVLTRRLIKAAGGPPESTIFTNSQGNAWKKVTAGARFRNLRESLHWNSDPLRKQYTCYSCRHTFAHRMLAGFWNNGEGCSIEVLAELMGDTPKVAFDHYGREWGQHYQEPLWQAIGC